MPVQVSRLVVPRIPNRWQRFHPAASWQEAQSRSIGYQALDVAGTTNRAAFEQPLTGNALATVGAFGVGLNAIRVNAAPVRVIDFGGFDGKYFHLIKSVFSQTRFEWTVVDLPHVVERFGSVGSSEIAYATDLEDTLASGADIVFASAALNYVPEPAELIATMFRYCRVVILTRLPLWPMRRHQAAVQRTQRNPEISYPTWFFSESQYFSQVAQMADVLLDFECPDDRASFNSNYLTYRGLVLERKPHLGAEQR